MLTCSSQKFKVRIEDPPRRRHMVFLGGAVLANIVSLELDIDMSNADDNHRWPTRKACGYPSKNGKNRVPALSTSWAPDERLMEKTNLYISRKQQDEQFSKRLLSKPVKLCFEQCVLNMVVKYPPTMPRTGFDESTSNLRMPTNSHDYKGR